MTRRIWIVDDDESIRWVLERAFSDKGWLTRVFASSNLVLDALRSDSSLPSLILTDVRMPGEDGMALLQRLQREYPQLPVVVMTAHSDLDSAVAAFKGGAFEYLAKPFDLIELMQVAERASEGPKYGAEEHIPMQASYALDKTELIGEAPALQEVFRAIGRLSRLPVSVLITGESGTGKELVAKALHKHSNRSDKPFIALNMAAIPAELIESELFGHEKGAFTGASHRRAGRFAQANGGTLFLDEIGDMPAGVQTRLLRVLAEGQYYPVGSHQLEQVDVRIIAATHQDLRQAITDGRFREDLYHRLNVIHLRLPTLSQRREDIAALAGYFLRRAGKELGVTPKHLSAEAIQLLEQAPWPGNVRQLENTCRWLTVMAPGERIGAADLPLDIIEQKDAQPSTDWEDHLRNALHDAFASGKNGAFKSFEQRFTQMAIDIALKETGGHRQNAAKLLGWGRNTLSRKLNS